MQANDLSFKLLFSLLLLTATNRAPASPPPVLTAQTLEGQQVRLNWPATATGFVLEQADALKAIVNWTAVAQAPVPSDGQFAVTLDAASGNRFFRLRGAPALTQIAETSPAAGEADVAVTRETVLRFSAPLAASSLLTDGQFFAGFGKRRLLTRPELSSDRQTATLFYLENIPASARIKVVFDADGLLDEAGHEVDADADGQPGGTLVLSFDTLGNTALPNTGVIGHVYASEKNTDGSNHPLSGVTVTVDGAEETVRTTTDATGAFRLQPAPAGDFFVHIDGRTALGSHWPNGAYYPFVGKQWTAQAGYANNLAGGTGEIYLPLIPDDTLQAVSTLTNTTITFAPSVLAANPALAGVEINVPANALFSESGARGGKVGIALVSPDRLPGPLPPGLRFPLVITIQTDGPQNFDRPVPIKFPNLPDSVTGVKLPPGAKSVLWSFNHDTGHWEIQGPATVTADGNFVMTDPDVGVRQPGWHGFQNGSLGGGNPPPSRCPGQPSCDRCPGGFSYPCKKAALGFFGSATDCGISALGPATGGSVNSCFWSVDTAVFGSVRDCSLDPSGCQSTSVLNGAGALLGCAGAFIPELKVASDIFGAGQCLLGLGNSLGGWQNCRVANGCAGSPAALAAASERQVPQQSPPSIGSNGFYEQLAWSQAYQEFLSVILGGTNWFGYPAGEGLRLRVLLEELGQSVDAGSPGGTSITTAERAALLALPMQGNVTSTEVSALIDRMDRMAAGILTPAELSPSALHSAAANLMAVYQELKKRGWQTEVDGYRRGLIDATQLMVEIRDDDDVAVGEHYFRVKELGGNFDLRGRLSPQGRFPAMVLTANKFHQVEYFDPKSGRIAVGWFYSSGPGLGTRIPFPAFFPSAVPSDDTDHDGLSDYLESIVGTSPTNPDTDSDGVSDFDEISNGRNPLDSTTPAEGLIASTPTSGLANDICLSGNLAVLAAGLGGVAIFDVSDPTRPVKVSEALTDAVIAIDAVAAEGNLVAAVNGSQCALLDISVPTAPTVRWRLKFPDIFHSVKIAGGIVFCGGNNGFVYFIDAASGSVLQTLRIDSGAVHDFWVSFPWLYAIVKEPTEGLHVLHFDAGLWGERTNILIPTTNAGLSPLSRSRLGATEAAFYATINDGFSVLDRTNPGQPTVLAKITTNPLIQTWRQLVPSFNGLALAAAGRNVSIYNLSPAGTNAQPAGTFSTVASVASALAVHGRYAYVADGVGGLAVIRHLRADTGTNPPAIHLAANTEIVSPALHTAGAPLAVIPSVTDDVGVDRVEFFVDGALATTSVSPPFETHVIPPFPTDQKATFTLQARAVDTAGNAAWSEVLIIGLLEPTDPPRLVATTPAADQAFLEGTSVSITAAFNRPIDPATLSSAFSLTNAGFDNQLGTTDDFAVPVTVAQVATTMFALNFTQPLAVGNYSTMVNTNLADVFGNHLQSNVVWSFRVGELKPALLPGSTNFVWGVGPNNGTNWSAGRPPTTNDFVMVDLPGDFPVRAFGNVAAGKLTVREPITFDGATLTIGDQAVFEKTVTMTNGTTFKGGTSTILDQLLVGGTGGGFGNYYLAGHTLNNQGHMTLNLNGYLMSALVNNSSPKDPDVINNLSGATFEFVGNNQMLAGSGFGFMFNNQGLILKSGAGRAVVELQTLTDSGTTHVQQGILTFQTQLANTNGYRYLGSYEVDAGARMEFGGWLPQFDQNSAITGDGDVEFKLGLYNIFYVFPSPKTTPMPGTYEVSGTTTISAPMAFNGTVRSSGPWIVLSKTSFPSLQVQLTGPMLVTSSNAFNLNIDPGTLLVDRPSGLHLTNSLTVRSGVLDIQTELVVDGPLIFNGAALTGPGRLRANGPVTFQKPKGFGVSLTPNTNHTRFEIATSAVCETNAQVGFNFNGLQTDATVLPGATLTLDRATQFSLNISNDGVVSKSDAINLQVGGHFTNRATLDVKAGLMNVSPFYNFTQTASGKLIMAVAGPNAGADFGQIHVEDFYTVTLDGTLEVRMSPTYDPPIGQEFVILQTKKLVGKFALVTGASLSDSKHLAVVYGPADVRLRVVPGP